MQILAFDFGTKKIGIAVGQTITKTSSPLAIIFNYRNKKDLSHLRWTVDEQRDLKFVREIYSRMKPKTLFSTNAILKILSEESHLQKINQGIIRNEGYLKSLREDSL